MQSKLVLKRRQDNKIGRPGRVARNVCIESIKGSMREVTVAVHPLVLSTEARGLGHHILGEVDFGL